MSTELSWAAKRGEGERSTSGAKSARWRKQTAPKMDATASAALRTAATHCSRAPGLCSIALSGAEGATNRTAASLCRARPERSHLSRHDVQHVALSDAPSTRRTPRPAPSWGYYDRGTDEAKPRTCSRQRANQLPKRARRQAGSLGRAPQPRDYTPSPFTPSSRYGHGHALTATACGNSSDLWQNARR